MLIFWNSPLYMYTCAKLHLEEIGISGHTGVALNRHCANSSSKQYNGCYIIYSISTIIMLPHHRLLLRYSSKQRDLPRVQLTCMSL